MENLRPGNCLDRPRDDRTRISNTLIGLLVLVFLCLASSSASAETRKLKLYFLHTGERAEITYKKNGRYVQGGLKKINRFLRDWRRNEPTKMDPRLLDLIWEVYQATGSRKHIHVISAYRSPATNNLLRKRGRGVAKKSQHTLGKALDFFIPGVSLRKLRNLGLRKGLGGVGYYPKSGSPFVHMDTGRVRHWPRMSRKELVRVFPKGKTLHVPTDGKPLARYNQAKAEYERKIKGGNKIVVARAEEIEKKPNVFARLLGRGDEEDGQLGAVSAPKPVAIRTTREDDRTPARVEPEVAKPQEAKPAELQPQPVELEPQPEPVQATPEIILASLPANIVPVPLAAPRAAPETDEPEIAVPDEAVPDVTEPTTVVAGLPDAPEQTTEIEGELSDQLGDDPNPAETIELAYGVPQPIQRPAPTPIEGLIAAADAERIDTTPPVAEPIRIAALSPVEIEDLRTEVYSALKTKPLSDTGIDRVIVPSASIPDADVESQIADASVPIEQNRVVEAPRLISLANARESEEVPSLYPQPNPKKIESWAIQERLAVLAPLEPGANTRNVTAVPSVRPVLAQQETEVANLEPLEPGARETDTLAVPSVRPQLQAETVEIASLEPLEPGVQATNEPALPSPNPDRQSIEIETPVSVADTSGVPVPTPAIRVASAEILVTDNRPVPASVESRLSALASSASTEKKLGKWALAADTLIERIGDIRPPAYAKNIIRERPSTVLSKGFVTNGGELATSSFSGSSIEFLDFTRF